MFLQSLSLSLSLCFILTHTISNSFRGTIGIELNQPTRGVSHFRNIVDPVVDASFECKKEKVSIAWLKHRWHSLGLRNLLLKITHLYSAKDSVCLSKKHNSPRLEDCAWIIEQLRFLLNQERREFSQGNPTSFLWKSYMCWAQFGFCYLHFNISCGEVTYVAMATGNWNFYWFWNQTRQNVL